MTDKRDILDKIRHAQALRNVDEHEAALYPQRAMNYLIEARDEIERLRAALAEVSAERDVLREDMRDRALRDGLGDMSKLGGF